MSFRRHGPLRSSGKSSSKRPSTSSQQPSNQTDKFFDSLGIEITSAIVSNDVTRLHAVVDTYLPKPSDLARLCLVTAQSGSRNIRCPLLTAVSLPSTDILRYLLEVCDFDPSHQHGGNRTKNSTSAGSKITTALHEAVRNGSIDAAEILLDYGADPVATDGAGRTPLELAVERADCDMTRLLISRGADQAAAANRTGDSCLHVVAALGHSQLAKTLIDDSGPSGGLAALSLPSTRTGELPVHVAAKAGHVHLVQMFCGMDRSMADARTKGFLDTRAAVDGVPAINDGTKRTPLHLAAESGHVETVLALLQLFAADPNVTDAAGDTPLHRVVAGRHRSGINRPVTFYELTAETLIKYSADIDKKNCNGLTAVDLATSNGWPKVVQMMQASPTVAGKDKNPKTEGNVPVTAAKSSPAEQVLPRQTSPPSGDGHVPAQSQSKPAVQSTTRSPTAPAAFSTQQLTPVRLSSSSSVDTPSLDLLDLNDKPCPFPNDSSKQGTDVGVTSVPAPLQKADNRNLPLSGDVRLPNGSNDVGDAIRTGNNSQKPQNEVKAVDVPKAYNRHDTNAARTAFIMSLPVGLQHSPPGKVENSVAKTTPGNTEKSPETKVNEANSTVPNPFNPSAPAGTSNSIDTGIGKGTYTPKIIGLSAQPVPYKSFGKIEPKVIAIEENLIDDSDDSDAGADEDQDEDRMLEADFDDNWDDDDSIDDDELQQSDGGNLFRTPLAAIDDDVEEIYPANAVPLIRSVIPEESDTSVQTGPEQLHPLSPQSSTVSNMRIQQVQKATFETLTSEDDLGSSDEESSSSSSDDERHAESDYERQHDYYLHGTTEDALPVVRGATDGDSDESKCLPPYQPIVDDKPVDSDDDFPEPPSPVRLQPPADMPLPLNKAFSATGDPLKAPPSKSLHEPKPEAEQILSQKGRVKSVNDQLLQDMPPPPPPPSLPDKPLSRESSNLRSPRELISANNSYNSIILNYTLDLVTAIDNQANEPHLHQPSPVELNQEEVIPAKKTKSKTKKKKQAAVPMPNEETDTVSTDTPAENADLTAENTFVSGDEINNNVEKKKSVKPKKNAKDKNPQHAATDDLGDDQLTSAPEEISSAPIENEAESISPVKTKKGKKKAKRHEQPQNVSVQDSADDVPAPDNDDEYYDVDNGIDLEQQQEINDVTCANDNADEVVLTETKKPRKHARRPEAYANVENVQESPLNGETAVADEVDDDVSNQQPMNTPNKKKKKRQSQQVPPNQPADDELVFVEIIHKNASGTDIPPDVAASANDGTSVKKGKKMRQREKSCDDEEPSNTDPSYLLESNRQPVEESDAISADAEPTVKNKPSTMKKLKALNSSLQNADKAQTVPADADPEPTQQNAADGGEETQPSDGIRTTKKKSKKLRSLDNSVDVDFTTAAPDPSELAVFNNVEHSPQASADFIEETERKAVKKKSTRKKQQSLDTSMPAYERELTLETIEPQQLLEQSSPPAEDDHQPKQRKKSTRKKLRSLDNLVSGVNDDLELTEAVAAEDIVLPITDSNGDSLAADAATRSKKPSSRKKLRNLNTSLQLDFASEDLALFATASEPLQSESISTGEKITDAPPVHKKSIRKKLRSLNNSLSLVDSEQWTIGADELQHAPAVASNENFEKKPTKKHKVPNSSLPSAVSTEDPTEYVEAADIVELVPVTAEGSDKKGRKALQRQQDSHVPEVDDHSTADFNDENISPDTKRATGRRKVRSRSSSRSRGGQRDVMDVPEIQDDVAVQSVADVSSTRETSRKSNRSAKQKEIPSAASADVSRDDFDPASNEQAVDHESVGSAPRRQTRRVQRSRSSSRNRCDSTPSLDAVADSAEQSATDTVAQGPANRKKRIVRSRSSSRCRQEQQLTPVQVEQHPGDEQGDNQRKSASNSSHANDETVPSPEGASGRPPRPVSKKLRTKSRSENQQDPTDDEKTQSVVNHQPKPSSQTTIPSKKSMPPPPPPQPTEYDDPDIDKASFIIVSGETESLCFSEPFAMQEVSTEPARGGNKKRKSSEKADAKLANFDDTNVTLENVVPETDQTLRTDDDFVAVDEIIAEAGKKLKKSSKKKRPSTRDDNIDNAAADDVVAAAAATSGLPDDVVCEADDVEATAEQITSDIPQRTRRKVRKSPRTSDSTEHQSEQNHVTEDVPLSPSKVLSDKKRNRRSQEGQARGDDNGVISASTNDDRLGDVTDAAVQSAKTAVPASEASKSKRSATNAADSNRNDVIETPGAQKARKKKPSPLKEFVPVESATFNDKPDVDDTKAEVIEVNEDIPEAVFARKKSRKPRSAEEEPPAKPSLTKHRSRSYMETSFEEFEPVMTSETKPLPDTSGSRSKNKTKDHGGLPPLGKPSAESGGKSRKSSQTKTEKPATEMNVSDEQQENEGDLFEPETAATPPPQLVDVEPNGPVESNADDVNVATSDTIDSEQKHTDEDSRAEQPETQSTEAHDQVPANAEPEPEAKPEPVPVVLDGSHLPDYEEALERWQANRISVRRNKSRLSSSAEKPARRPVDDDDEDVDVVLDLEDDDEPPAAISSPFPVEAPRPQLPPLSFEAASLPVEPPPSNVSEKPPSTENTAPLSPSSEPQILSQVEAEPEVKPTINPDFDIDKPICSRFYERESRPVERSTSQVSNRSQSVEDKSSGSHAVPTSVGGGLRSRQSSLSQRRKSRNARRAAAAAKEEEEEALKFRPIEVQQPQRSLQDAAFEVLADLCEPISKPAARGNSKAPDIGVGWVAECKRAVYRPGQTSRQRSVPNGALRGSTAADGTSIHSGGGTESADATQDSIDSASVPRSGPVRQSGSVSFEQDGAIKRRWLPRNSISSVDSGNRNDTSISTDI